jgi:hypothetical protein
MRSAGSRIGIRRRGDPRRTSPGGSSGSESRASARRAVSGLGEGAELGFAIALDPQFLLLLAAPTVNDLRETYLSIAVRALTASLGEAVHALQERPCALAISAQPR